MTHVHAFLGSRSLHFVAMILEPDLDLSWGKAQQTGEMFPLWSGEVPLLPEAPLKFIGLRLREQNPSLSPLAHIAVVCRGLFIIVL